jgi:hypothetical protein
VRVVSVSVVLCESQKKVGLFRTPLQQFRRPPFLYIFNHFAKIYDGLKILHF